MNVERRRRQLLALINDPATFEGERENARRALERLDAKAPPPQAERGRAWTWEPRITEDIAADMGDVEFTWTWTPGPSFEEMLRRFREAAETPAERQRRWHAPAERQRRWHAPAERQRRWHEAAGAGFRAAGARPARDDTSGYRAAAEGGAHGPLPSDDDDEWGIHL